MKKLLVFVMLVGGYLTASAQVPSVVAITSDGNEYEYRPMAIIMTHGQLTGLNGN